MSRARDSSGSTFQRLLKYSISAAVKAFDLDVGVLLVDGGDYLHVLLERPVGVVAAYHVDLSGVFVHVVQDFLHGHLVGVGVTLLLGEVAELAAEDADIGGVQMPVEDEVDSVAFPLALNVVGHASHGRQVRSFRTGGRRRPWKGVAQTRVFSHIGTKDASWKAIPSTTFTMLP